MTFLLNSHHFRKGIGLRLTYFTRTISLLLLQALPQLPSMALTFYGYVQSILLVTDSAFQDARNVLQANGYKDAPIDSSDFQMMKPVPEQAVEWRLLSRSGRTTTLVPASHWHFDVTDDTTIIVDGMRLPKFSSYLHGE